MSAKQIRSGYILWKTGPEPVRHSHSGERPAFDCTPTGIGKAHRRQVSSGRGIRRRRQYGGEQTPSASTRSKEILRDSAVGGKLFQPAPAPKKRLENSAEKAGLFQLVSVPKRFPGAVQEEADCPRQTCSKETSKKKCGEGQAAPGSACSEEIAGTGQTGGISPEASAWGQQSASARTEKHPEGHRALRVFCYVGEITSSGRFQTTAESPSGGAAGAGACPTGTAHGFRP